MAVNLNPCPVCGPNNISYLRLHKLGWYYVKCHSCGKRSEPEPTEAGAVAVWNGTPVPPRPVTYAQRAERRDAALVTVRRLRGTPEMQSKEFLDALEIVLAEFPEKG